MSRKISDTAMVLAAGLGRRLRPLTNDLPKPLVEVAGRTLIDRTLDRLTAAGVSRVVINLHHRGGRLRDHLTAPPAAGPEIIFSDETGRLLDTGGGVKAARRHFRGQPFLVINGDVLWLNGTTDTLGRLAAAWDPEIMDALLLMVPVAGSVGYGGAGDFTMAGDGLLLRRLENQVAPFVFGGLQILSPHLFEDTPDGPFSLNLLYDRALARRRLFGLRHDGLWMHVGTPEGFDQANRRLEPPVKSRA